MTRTIIITILIIISLLTGLALFQLSKQPGRLISPTDSLKQETEPTPKPLEQYQFESLKQRRGRSSEIKLEQVLKEEDKFTVHLFSFITQGGKVTGLAHMPKDKTNAPVIIMLRGYVDQAIYETGVGTQRAGQVFSENGFITLAPDFLGYGQSDMPPNDVWEERFLRLTTVIDLLVSLETLHEADLENVFIWGHSNGGMVALSVLEITGEEYPTTLWAPVSQFFPYDVLYYTNEFDDKGMALRKNLADFEKEYNVNKYSFDEYLEWIQAPMIIHQGTADQYIPMSWINNLVERLRKLEKDIVLYTYSKADHNMQGVWETVVQRDLQFFQDNLN